MNKQANDHSLVELITMGFQRKHGFRCMIYTGIVRVYVYYIIIVSFEKHFFFFIYIKRNVEIWNLKRLKFLFIFC